MPKGVGGGGAVVARHAFFCKQCERSLFTYSGTYILFHGDTPSGRSVIGTITTASRIDYVRTRFVLGALQARNAGNGYREGRVSCCLYYYQYELYTNVINRFALVVSQVYEPPCSNC